MKALRSTVARLTQSQSSLKPCIPVALGSNDFMTFFNNKIVLIREKIHQHLSSLGTDDSLIIGSLDSALRLDVHLNCFASVEFQQLQQLNPLDQQPVFWTPSQLNLDMINPILLTRLHTAVL